VSRQGRRRTGDKKRTRALRIRATQQVFATSLERAPPRRMTMKGRGGRAILRWSKRRLNRKNIKVKKGSLRKANSKIRLPDDTARGVQGEGGEELKIHVQLAHMH